VSAEEIVLGKVIGIVAASLLQILIWLAMLLALPVFLLLTSDFSFNLDFELSNFLFAAAFTLLGMLFYGLVIASCGVGQSDSADSIGNAKVIQVIFVLSFYMAAVCLFDASAVWWRAFTALPLFTPILVLFQLVDPEYSLIEASCFLLLMLVYVALMIKFAGRILRLSMMLRGQQIGFFATVKMLLSPNLGC